MPYSDKFVELVRETYLTTKSHKTTAKDLGIDESFVWAVNIGYENGLNPDAIAQKLDNVHSGISIGRLKKLMTPVGRKRG